MSKEQVRVYFNDAFRPYRFFLTIVSGSGFFSRVESGSNPAESLTLFYMSRRDYPIPPSLSLLQTIINVKNNCVDPFSRRRHLQRGKDR